MLKKHFNKFVRSDEENLFVKYSPRGKKMSFANKTTNYVFLRKLHSKSVKNRSFCRKNEIRKHIIKETLIFFKTQYM